MVVVLVVKGPVRDSIELNDGQISWMDRAFARQVLAEYGETAVESYLRHVVFYDGMVPLCELLHWRQTGATHALEEGRRDLVRVHSR